VIVDGNLLDVGNDEGMRVWGDDREGVVNGERISKESPWMNVILSRTP